MTTIRVICSACWTTTSVAASRVVLGCGKDGVSSLTSQCPGCGHVSARLLDAGAAVKLAAHIPCTTVGQPRQKAAPVAPPFTLDDSLDLHIALQQPNWFDELGSIPRCTSLQNPDRDSGR